VKINQGLGDLDAGSEAESHVILKGVAREPEDLPRGGEPALDKRQRRRLADYYWPNAHVRVQAEARLLVDRCGSGPQEAGFDERLTRQTVPVAGVVADDYPHHWEMAGCHQAEDPSQALQIPKVKNAKK
jgi:hypothetical protein